MKSETHASDRLITRILLFVSLTLTFLWLQGCASGLSMPMAPEDRAALRNAPVIHVVRYTSVPLSLMTPAGVAGASLITSATGSTELPSGPELQRAYSLTPASDELTNQLVQKLKDEAKLSNLQVESAPLPLPFTEDVSGYRKKYASGLVLEITGGISAGYQVMHWKTYNFGMHGNARLIRIADGKVLWKDMCSVGGQNDESLTLDVSEFEANKGARLKTLIQRSGNSCSRILVNKLLGNT